MNPKKANAEQYHLLGIHCQKPTTQMTGINVSNNNPLIYFAEAEVLPSAPRPIRTIGQDLTAPFTIFIDGAEFSDFPSLAQADAVYMELRQKMTKVVQ